MNLPAAQILVPGTGSGEVLRLQADISFWGAIDPLTGRVIDRRHPQFGICIAGRIVVLRRSIGSSSGSAILMETLIECRICDGVCPSGIPLTAIFQDMKRSMFLQKEEAEEAEYAELRFQRRKSRLIANTASIRHRPSKADTAALLAHVKGDAS